MRKATFAKLSLTAAVGLGTLLGQGTLAQAETPPANGGVKVIAQPTTTTTIKPLPAFPVGPCGQIKCIPADEVDPTPPLGPEDKLSLPEADDCDLLSCDKTTLPQPDPDPECNPQVLCDEITSDPGCTVTHGDCDDGPICRPEGPGQAARSADSCDEDECDEPGPGPTRHAGEDPCDEEDPCEPEEHSPRHESVDECDEDDPCEPQAVTRDLDDEIVAADACDEGTTGGDDGGTDGPGGRLPKTGAEMATWALAGLGLTGVGAALKKLGQRQS